MGFTAHQHKKAILRRTLEKNTPNTHKVINVHKVINACRSDMEWICRDNNLQFFPVT